MTLVGVCLLYTQDLDLVRRVKAFLRTTTQVRLVAEPDRLEAVLQQTSPALLFMDLRAKECHDLIDQIQQEWPEVLIIALGTLRSEPLRAAEQLGIYAAEDLQLDRRRFQALVGRAFELLRVMQENRDLRETARLVTSPPAAGSLELNEDRPLSPSLPLLRFPRIFRRFDNVDTLLEKIVENVADTTAVTRVGIFSKNRNGHHYRLRAGLRCLPETYELEYGARDPLVQWFELHAHLISRSNAQDSEPAHRPLLRRALDTFGAEVILPLYADGLIIGWLFLGHRVGGQPFDYNGLQALTILSEHVSTVLENALLNEENTLQKILAETLLKSIPTGIVATDEEGVIRWFNPMAEQILGLPSVEVINKAAETAGSRLAGSLRAILESDAPVPPQRWIDPNTRRSLAVETRRLADRGKRLGAVAVVQDVTGEESLQHKKELVDRAAFWTDLASGMSHEIRNPLVAIKTFAQLLPERFNDPDFRKDFNKIVVQEIDRLDKIITQINDFAHPPELSLKPLDLRAPVKKAVEIARSRLGPSEMSIETTLPMDLPQVLGDESALAEAFAQLVANAAEATSGQKKGHVSLDAKPVREGERASGVVVTVRDNGKGIAPALKGKIFSPFCTTKARGMGLGLPIVKRTVFDHNGRVDIDSSSHGTLVSVLLPASPNGH